MQVASLSLTVCASQCCCHISSHVSILALEMAVSVGWLVDLLSRLLVLFFREKVRGVNLCFWVGLCSIFGSLCSVSNLYLNPLSPSFLISKAQCTKYNFIIQLDANYVICLTKFEIKTIHLVFGLPNIH